MISRPQQLTSNFLDGVTEIVVVKVTWWLWCIQSSTQWLRFWSPTPWGPCWLYWPWWLCRACWLCWPWWPPAARERSQLLQEAGEMWLESELPWTRWGLLNFSNLFRNYLNCKPEPIGGVSHCPKKFHIKWKSDFRLCICHGFIWTNWSLIYTGVETDKKLEVGPLPSWSAATCHRLAESHLPAGQVGGEDDRGWQLASIILKNI